jgi:hypothetical protein
MAKSRRIKGYWLITSERGGHVDMQAEYGYDEDNRCVTSQGIIFRGSRAEADRDAQGCHDDWVKSGRDLTFSVRPLMSDDHFDVYQDHVDAFLGRHHVST